MKTHKHKCGLGRLGALDPRGCGHVWEHPDPDGTETDAVYAARHVCPKCGLGNQVWRHDEDTSQLESLAFQLVKLLMRGTIEVAEDDERDQELHARRRRAQRRGAQDL